MSMAPRTTTRRRGRPPADNPRNDRRTACFTASEGRAFNAWMKKNKISVDSEALIQIVKDRLAADGITDPGPDSENGQLAPSPWRVRTDRPATTEEGPAQLALTA